MEPCPVLRAALWKYTEFIAVIQIQRPEAGYLAHLLPLAHRIDLLPLFRSLWMGNLRQGLGQNTPPYPIFGVCRPKVPGKAHKALLSGRSHGDVLAELHRIALLAQQVIKLLFADAFPDQLVDFAADQATPCGALLLLGPPFPVVFRLSQLGLLHHGQAVFPAKFVGDSPHFVIVFPGTVVADAIHKGYGVHHKMTMQVVFLIQMGGDQHLIFLAPQLPGQLYADLMGQFRCSLTGGKGLIPMIGDDTVLLAEALLDCQHLIPCRCGQTVDAADQLSQYGDAFAVQRLRRFIQAGGVVNDIR